MGSARTPQPDLRLFVAVYPPERVARALLAELDALSIPEHRITPVEQVHMTLQFIGDTRTKDLERVRESVERSVSGIHSFVLTPIRLLTLPERRPARLIAATTDAPAALLEIHRRLAHRLARETRKNTSDRFLPHFTLCRFARGTTGARADREIACEPFRVASVSLVKSVLRPGGAAHAEVARFPLADD